MKGTIIKTNLECLGYFIRHKMVFTVVLLNKFGMEQSATCKVCQEDDEGFLHLFLHGKELEYFNGKCKSIFEDLKRKQNDEDWNKVVMLGLEVKI